MPAQICYLMAEFNGLKILHGFDFLCVFLKIDLLSTYFAQHTCSCLFIKVLGYDQVYLSNSKIILSFIIFIISELYKLYSQFQMGNWTCLSELEMNLELCY